MQKYARDTIQAMPLIAGKTNLTATAGQVKVSYLIHCVIDGDVAVKWASGQADTIVMIAGQDFAFEGLLTIVSGTFHIN